MALLDPTQLNWQQFWVIEVAEQIVGCGQLRSFEGSQELGSVVVSPAWRNRGLGTAIVQQLIQTASQPLYLECLGNQLPAFYAQFGFVPVDWQDLPPSLKRKFAISALAKKFLRLHVSLMRYQPIATPNP